MKFLLTLISIMTLILAGCSNEETTTQGTETKEDAVTTTEFEIPESGILAYWLEGGGEGGGNGFNLELNANGKAKFWREWAEGPDKTIEIGYDSDSLIEILKNTDYDKLVVGSRDCQPELDGSAPRLKLSDVEIDLCYEELDQDNEIIPFLQDIEKDAGDTWNKEFGYLD